MLRLIIFTLLHVLIFTQCNKGDSINENSLSFSFNLDNSYIIEGTLDTISTGNGYHQISYSSGLSSLPTATEKIWLIDGEIKDTLTTCCSNYNFLTPPTTTVVIWFPTNTLSNGLYDYNLDSTINDFEISIKNNMEFNNDFYDSNLYQLSAENMIGSTSGFSSNYSKISEAEILIKNINTDSADIKYLIQTIGGFNIKGSYYGSLESFTHIDCDSDCD